MKREVEQRLKLQSECDEFKQHCPEVWEEMKRRERDSKIDTRLVTQ